MKSVCLTFDDGFRSHFDFARPMLQQRGLAATFFVSGSFIPRRACDRLPRLVEGYRSSSVTEFMTWDEISILHAAGFEIGNHLGKHVDMRKVNDMRLQKYARSLDDKLMRLGLPKTTTLAYPSFFIDDRVKAFAESYGFVAARSGCAVPHDDYQYGAFGGFLKLPFQDKFDVNCSMVFGRQYGFASFVKDISSLPDDGLAVLCFHDFNSSGLSVDIELREFENILDHIATEKIRTVTLAAASML